MTRPHSIIKSLKRELSISSVMRFEAYETIGGLFAEDTGVTVELSVAHGVWRLIVEETDDIAGFAACNPFELIENVINNNNQSSEASL